MGKYLSNSERRFSKDFTNICDGKLHTEDGYTFNIHKFELAKKSNYFYNLFRGDSGRTDFLIPVIRGEVLGNVLTFIYEDNLNVTEENVGELLVAADYVLLCNLIDHIKKFSLNNSLTISNCLSIYLAALNINRKDILKESYRFIQTHFEMVVGIEDSELGQLPCEALEHFLGNKSLRVRDETAVWVAIAKWVQTDLPHRQSLVPYLITYLKVSGVSEQLAQNILEHDIVANNSFCSELNILKAFSLDSNLETFKNYIQHHPVTTLYPFECRLPDNLVVVVNRIRRKPRLNDYIICTTYDGQIDLWRKMFEINYDPEFIVCINYNIFVFSQVWQGEQGNEVSRFNMIEKGWRPMRQFEAHTQLGGYRVIQLKGLIYVLGGRDMETGEYRGDLEVYHPVEDLWSDLPPMITVFPCRVAILREKIYVVGRIPHSRGMIMQLFDNESGSWIVLTSPHVYRYNFELVTYRGKAYVLGGVANNQDQRKIELFDPVAGKWTMHEDLPQVFYQPKGIVLNNELIIYEYRNFSSSKTTAAVLWDEKEGHWKVLEECSPLNILSKYTLFPHDNNNDCINWILKENQKPGTQFMNSPFHS